VPQSLSEHPSSHPTTSARNLASQTAVDLSIMDPEPVPIVEEFRHASLPQEQSIRLLRINEDIPGSISFTLDAFPLDQLPEFEALSYTWGKATLNHDEVENNDPGVLHTIMVNNVPFTINENLHDGLYELRDEIQGYLWVDALCIDQENDQERPSQVTLMGDIYSSAKGVSRCRRRIYTSFEFSHHPPPDNVQVCPETILIGQLLTPRMHM
jgi:hypothetical protein